MGSRRRRTLLGAGGAKASRVAEYEADDSPEDAGADPEAHDDAALAPSPPAETGAGLETAPSQLVPEPVATEDARELPRREPPSPPRSRPPMPVPIVSDPLMDAPPPPMRLKQGATPPAAELRAPKFVGAARREDELVAPHHTPPPAANVSMRPLSVAELPGDGVYDAEPTERLAASYNPLLSATPGPQTRARALAADFSDTRATPILVDRVDPAESPLKPEGERASWFGRTGEPAPQRVVGRSPDAPVVSDPVLPADGERSNLAWLLVVFGIVGLVVVMLFVVLITTAVYRGATSNGVDAPAQVAPAPIAPVASPVEEPPVEEPLPDEEVAPVEEVPLDPVPSDQEPPDELGAPAPSGAPRPKPRPAAAPAPAPAPEEDGASPWGGELEAPAPGPAPEPESGEKGKKKKKK